MLDVNNTKVLSSLDVAELMEVEHKNLLRKIKDINDILHSSKMSSEKYWVESSFTSRGKLYPCYNITKEGCAFLAHKTSGKKGTIFTARYMDRFEEMEKTLQSQSYSLPTTYLEALEALVASEKEKIKLENETKVLKQDNIHKQEVIKGLVDNVTLAEKRQRINQIVRYENNNYKERYNLLYDEFERKYHMRLHQRMTNPSLQSIKPKIKNKMDYIDRVLNMTDELYEIAITLFETDYNYIMEKFNI